MRAGPIKEAPGSWLNSSQTRRVPTACGIIGADARPNWQEQPGQETLTWVARYSLPERRPVLQFTAAPCWRRVSRRVGKAFHNPSLTGQGRGDYVLEGGRTLPDMARVAKSRCLRASAVLGALKLTRIGEAFAAWHGKKGCKEPCA